MTSGFAGGVAGAGGPAVITIGGGNGDGLGTGLPGRKGKTNGLAGARLSAGSIAG